MVKGFRIREGSKGSQGVSKGVGDARESLRGFRGAPRCFRELHKVSGTFQGFSNGIR